MTIDDLIALAVSNYTPSTPTAPSSELQQDVVMQLASDAIDALVHVFGNDIADILLIFRWQHERGELALLDGKPREWFIGFTQAGDRYFGPYPSFGLARDGLMLLVRKAMAEAFENYKLPRAAELRIVLDSLKDAELTEGDFSNTISDDERWFITEA
jgi:hypothetical protein